MSSQLEETLAVVRRLKDNMARKERLIRELEQAIISQHVEADSVYFPRLSKGPSPACTACGVRLEQDRVIAVFHYQGRYWHAYRCITPKEG